MARKDENGVETLESGDLYFFYRPKVEREEAEGVADVQRLYMVMHPDDRERYRLTVIGRKKLPEPAAGGRDRYWGFVETVRKDPKGIRAALGGGEYETKTRGERHLPTARPAGEGVYRILRHGTHTHLVYALELPARPGEVQKELNIEPEASYVISIANPERRGGNAPGLSEHQQAEFPQRLRVIFRGRKFADADPPDFLDHEGTEFLLIAAAEDLRDELGIELDTEEESAGSADIFNDLRIDRSRRPTAPLFEGKWE